MDLVLHHYWRSSSSWRVRFALAHKEIAFTAIAVNLLEGEQKKAEFLETSPIGYVPALVIDRTRVLSESVAICEWLEDAFPARPLRPSDPWLRARMRQLVEIVAADIQPVQNLVVLRKASADKEAQAEWARFFIERGLAAIERVLRLVRAEGAKGDHCLGAELSLADFFLVPQLYNARRFGVDLAPFPLVVAAEAAALATEAAKASHPDVWEPKPPKKAIA